MRRLVVLLLAVVLILALAVGAGAETQVTSMRIVATVSPDRSAQVMIAATVRLESSVSELNFPVPQQARDVTLNGKRVRVQSGQQGRYFDLAGQLGGMAGELSFTVNFTLDEVLETSQAGTPQVVLPLLSGFAYPVEVLEYSVTLPSQVDAKPAFSSGYYQTGIEENLASVVDGNMITGTSLGPMNDHETLTMTLTVPEGMFLSAPIHLRDTVLDDIGMAVCAVLALLYWLLALRTGPLKRQEAVAPPDGFGAGEVGSVLALGGMDLNLAVFTWAQLGYVQLEQYRDRVYLHKRMDMGNERSAFEQRWFLKLFSRGAAVDTGKLRYGALCLQARVLSPQVQNLLLRRSGNPRIFRVLGAGIALFGGVAVGAALGAGAVLQWFLGILMGAAGLWAGWKIQLWAQDLRSLGKRNLWMAAGIAAVWMLLGMLSGTAGVSAVAVLSQLLVGLMASFGGRRTQEGRQTAQQLLGLRKHLRSLSREDVKRLTELDPDYFYTMAPYALALGVMNRFARSFGPGEIAPCPYFTPGVYKGGSATQWGERMVQAYFAMEAISRPKVKEELQKRLQMLIGAFTGGPRR